MDIGTAIIGSTCVVCFTTVWLRLAEHKLREQAFQYVVRQQADAQARLQRGTPTPPPTSTAPPQAGCDCIECRSARAGDAVVARMKGQDGGNV